MKVLFNTEGNKSIGMGAFYNCLILARAFQGRLSAQAQFLISDDSQDGIEENLLAGYKARRVNMEDSGLFLDCVKDFSPDVIVQDILSLKEEYMDGLSRLKATVVNISHIPDFRQHLKADMVINLLYDSAEVRCLYGPRYAILDDRFMNLGRRKISKAAQSILIAFGGADVNNLTLELMDLLDGLGLDTSVNIVTGPGFRDGHKVEERMNGLRNKERFTLHGNVSSILELMLANDLAFVSGGRLICELAAAGTPAIAFAQNELEFNRLKEFQNWGSVLNCGYYKKDAAFLGEIKKIILDRQARENMSKAGQELVDGNGVNRIMDAVLGE